jgi:hypothetical protein
MANTYSFLDVQAAIVGPGGSISLGSGAGTAEEGISVEPASEMNRMTIGSDGTPMHSLIADKSGRVIVRLLKTSPTNALLNAMLIFQRTSSANHGQNTLSIGNNVLGDLYTCEQVAFAKVPNNTYAKDANMIEWNFDAGIIFPSLGAGI